MGLSDTACRHARAHGCGSGRMRMRVLLFCASLSAGFVCPPAARGPVVLRRADASDEAEMLEEYEARVAQRDVKERLVGQASTFASSIQENLAQEPTGPSVAFVGAQAVLLLLLAVGDVPMLGAPLQAVTGPGLILGGLGLIAAGVLELGPTNLTPYPNPVEKNDLKTNGIFGACRHPIYGGLLLAAAGLSLATFSFQRALVTAGLYLLLDAKSDYEEKCLREVHPAYLAYKQTTPKFFPKLVDFEDDDDA